MRKKLKLWVSVSGVLVVLLRICGILSIICDRSVLDFFIVLVFFDFLWVYEN